MAHYRNILLVSYNTRYKQPKLLYGFEQLYLKLFFLAFNGQKLKLSNYDF